MSFRGTPRGRGTGANFGGGGGRGGGGFGGRGGPQFHSHTAKQLLIRCTGRGGFQQRDNGPPADVLGKFLSSQASDFRVLGPFVLGFSPSPGHHQAKN